MGTYRCGEDCGRCGKCSRVSRRQFLKQMAGGLALCGIGALASACAPLTDEPPTATEESTPTPIEPGPPSYAPPTGGEAWTSPPSHRGDLPVGEGTLEIKGIGKLPFDATEIKTLRPDIFKPEHFSLFDILVHLSERGDIALDYHFDEEMNTHIIDAINGRNGWWYEAYYSNGWPEPNAFRMDMYPYKNNMRIRLSGENKQRLEVIYRAFREEVERLARNRGQVIIPDLAIQSPAEDWVFKNVVVTPHDVRSDVLQPGVVTALDALISLREQEQLPVLELTWYETIGRADPADSYWVEQVDNAVAAGGCGFVYETGPRDFAGFTGSHIHIPADVRVTVSPEYALWFWICL
jgi:hypothetical protein